MIYERYIDAVNNNNNNNDNNNNNYNNNNNNKKIQPAVTKNLINSSKTLSSIPSVTKETPRPSLENKNNPIYYK